MSAIDFDIIYKNGIVRNQTAENNLPEPTLDKYNDFCKSLIATYPHGHLGHLIGIAAYCLRVLQAKPDAVVTLDNIFKFD